MQRLTNLNYSLTHWNSIQSSSELLISQQNLLPNLPFLEHLSGRRHRFPLSLQQYLEKINIALFVCFSLSPHATEKLLSTRKQPTFPPSDQKRNNLPQKFTNHTALLPHILLGFKTRCVCTGAAGTVNKAQGDITCRFSCIHTTYNPPFNPLLPEAQKSAFCLILPVFAAPNSSRKENFPKPAVSRPVSSRLALHGLRRFFQSPLPAAHPSAALPSTHPPTRPLTGPAATVPFSHAKFGRSSSHRYEKLTPDRSDERILPSLPHLPGLGRLWRGGARRRPPREVRGAECTLRAAAGALARRRPARPLCRAGRAERRKSEQVVCRSGTPWKAGGGRRTERLGAGGWTGATLRVKPCQTKSPSFGFFLFCTKATFWGAKLKQTDSHNISTDHLARNAAGCSLCRQLNHRDQLTLQTPAGFMTGIFFCPSGEPFWIYSRPGKYRHNF